MVGTVGAVNMPAIGRATDAIKDAFSIIRGWDQDARKPIAKWLEQLQEAIKDNKKVYDQAASTINNNSANIGGGLILSGIEPAVRTRIEGFGAIADKISEVFGVRFAHCSMTGVVVEPKLFCGLFQHVACAHHFTVSV